MDSGIVIKNMNGYFYVQDEAGVVAECKVKGRLKQSRYSLLVGDRVGFERTGADGTEAFIGTIETRRNQLRRPAVANLDGVVLVVAAREPDINIRLLDKLIVMIEHADIPLTLCINKWDLATDDTKVLASVYEAVGYPVVCTSTVSGEGIDELRTHLEGKVSAFAGPSGVGKSSLLNAVEPAFSFRTGAVSEKIRRGRHTTRHASLFSLNECSFIMDTPGFSVIEFEDISPERLPSLFPEFRKEEGDCKFNQCYHVHEPICGVKAAVDAGTISRERYRSYLDIREEILRIRKF